MQFKFNQKNIRLPLHDSVEPIDLPIIAIKRKARRKHTIPTKLICRAARAYTDTEIENITYKSMNK